MADAAAQRHQQLKNEANKMAMKIPFFHGDNKEDSLEIKEMIRRFENSADFVGLANNAEKCNMFGETSGDQQLFYGKAWNSMENQKLIGIV